MVYALVACRHKPAVARKFRSSDPMLQRKLQNRRVGVVETRWYLLSASVRRPFRLFLTVGAVSLVFALCMQGPFQVVRPLQWPEAEANLGRELWRWAREMGWTVNIFAKHGQFEHWFPYDPPAWTTAAELKGSLVVYGLLAVTDGWYASQTSDISKHSPWSPLPTDIPVGAGMLHVRTHPRRNGPRRDHLNSQSQSQSLNPKTLTKHPPPHHLPPSLVHPRPTPRHP